MIKNGVWGPNDHDQTRMLSIHGGFLNNPAKKGSSFTAKHTHHAFKSAITCFNPGIKRPNNHFTSTITGSNILHLIIMRELRLKREPINLVRRWTLVLVEKEKPIVLLSNPSIVLFKHTHLLFFGYPLIQRFHAPTVPTQHERLTEGGRFAEPESFSFDFHCFKVENGFLDYGEWILAL